MENHVLVNAMGEACPMPVVKATQALREMTEAGVLEVLVDNEIAVQNLTRMGAGKGYAVQAEKQGDAKYAVRILVNTPPTEAAPAPEPACVPDARGDVVVAVGSSTMGQGNDELGATLMKGFLFAVSQLPKLPKTILFYNGGAKLTTEGSASLEDLKKLEAQGVEVLTCGTCLNYYGLTEKLAVGGVTNMYAIVEKLAAASHVIRP
ncbi:MAG: sulfurtransferase-like selenium metabolism protein YedF [Candidatus Avoscillospira sp.]